MPDVDRREFIKTSIHDIVFGIWGGYFAIHATRELCRAIIPGSKLVRQKYKLDEPEKQTELTGTFKGSSYDKGFLYAKLNVCIEPESGERIIVPYYELVIGTKPLQKLRAELQPGDNVTLKVVKVGDHPYDYLGLEAIVKPE